MNKNNKHPQNRRKRAHKRGLYDVYVDGSVFESGLHAGAGWVLVNRETGKTVEETGRRIDECARATSTLAEIYAASAALNRIAAGSTITLHTDDLDLCGVVRAGAMNLRIARNTTKPDLQNAFQTLFNAVSRHEAVTAEKVHIDACPPLRAAHNAAREAAAPRRHPAPPSNPAP